MKLVKKGEVKMKEVIKKGVCVTLIYLIAILCTVVLQNRIERLESNISYDDLTETSTK